MGVLDEFLYKKYGAPTRAVENSMVDPGVVGVDAVQFLRRNGNRVGFTVVNLSVNTVYLGFHTMTLAIFDDKINYFILKNINILMLFQFGPDKCRISFLI